MVILMFEIMGLRLTSAYDISKSSGVEGGNQIQASLTMLLYLFKLTIFFLTQVSISL